ncbi:MAG: SCO family protein [Gemmatimonadetes bacterium]|nr:SCO family protein [Gemmatimonadota bacterium]
MANSLAPRLQTRETAAAAALAFIVVVTVAWWSLALWPVAGAVPPWLATTRAWCFGSQPNGLPSPVGWMLLIGEPIAMIIALMIIAGDAVPAAIRAIASHRAGKITLVAIVLLKVGGLSAAAVRIAHVQQAERAAAEPDPRTMPPAERLDRLAPPLALIDQHGDAISLARFRGRAVLVAFAYAHCETVCPVVVRETLKAQAILNSGGRAGGQAGSLTEGRPDLQASAGPPARRPAVVFITLDPWRDTPGRLSSIADSWKLGTDAFVASGAVPDVEQVLDSWNVARTRDPGTGQLTHATPVYLIAPDGRVAYLVSPFADAIVRAARELDS